MRARSLADVAVAVAVCAGLLAPTTAAGQSAAGQTAARKAVAEDWTPPRTPWGDPDLQGTYTNKTITPIERPLQLADQEFLTAEEAATIERQVVERNQELLNRPARRTEATASVDAGVDGAPGFYNNFWLDRGTASTGRTSIIVDPPDGRIPPLTPEAQRREDARLAARRMRGPTDTWTDLDLNDRCMLWSVGPPMLPTGYNNNCLFLQTPDHVVIHVEMIHDTRIIPLDGRPRIGPLVPQWLGEMRGHWEGDTLVVETTNLATTEEGSAFGNDPIRIRAAAGGGSGGLRIVERFTRTGPDTIRYQFTVEDPSRWTRPWSGELPMRPADGPLFEYACHEGNYSIANVLSGERANDRQAAAETGGSR